jgi:hypothetical protein
MKSKTTKGNAADMPMRPKDDIEPLPSTPLVDSVTEDTRRSLDRWLASLSYDELARLSKNPWGDPDMLRYLQEEISRRERAPPFPFVLKTFPPATSRDAARFLNTAPRKTQA